VCRVSDMTAALTLSMPAVLTHSEAQACLQDWVQRLPAQGDVWLDASALHRFDSSALAVLLALQRAALGRGCRVQVRELPARARQLAQVYGIEPGLGLSVAA
jgi:phospholipid transport system transporter-binding protein